MKKALIYLLVVAALAALITGGLLLRHQRQQQLADAAPPQPMPWSLRVAEVTRARATRGFPALALVRGANEVAISAQLSGILLEMTRREGQRVAEGGLLARIDPRELEDKLASLEAQRAGAEADAKRLERDAVRAAEVLRKHGISESEADRQRAAADSAREKVNSLNKDIAAERTRLGYATITAPFAGVISDRLADPGDLATLGKALYRLIGTDSSRLEVRLPAEVLEQVKIGSEVQFSHGGNTLTLTAARVFPSLDERSLGRLEVDVSGMPFDTVPGTLLRARVITAALDDALLVPADALLPSTDPGSGKPMAHVFKLSQAQPPTLTKVPVEILLKTRTGVAVAGELSPGDRVVVAHETQLRRLREGDTVRAVMVTP